MKGKLHSKIKSFDQKLKNELKVILNRKDHHSITTNSNACLRKSQFTRVGTRFAADLENLERCAIYVAENRVTG